MCSDDWPGSTNLFAEKPLFRGKLLAAPSRNNDVNYFADLVVSSSLLKLLISQKDGMLPYSEKSIIPSFEVSGNG